MTGLVGVGSRVAGGDEDIDPRGGEFQELLVFDGDLAPRPVQECLTEAEADRQLPHPWMGGDVVDDPVEGAIECGE